MPPSFPNGQRQRQRRSPSSWCRSAAAPAVRPGWCAGPSAAPSPRVARRSSPTPTAPTPPSPPISTAYSRPTAPTRPTCAIGSPPSSSARSPTASPPLVDLGGGDLLLKQLAREIGLVPFLERHDIRPVALHLIGPDRDDLAYLHDVEQDGLFAPTATVLVLNEALVPARRAIRTAFQDTVLKHPTFLTTLERGAKVVWMPRLEVAHEIDSRRLSFTAAEENQVKPGQPPIGPWNRQLIHNWLRDMETNFAPVAHWLP